MIARYFDSVSVFLLVLTLGCYSTQAAGDSIESRLSASDAKIFVEICEDLREMEDHLANCKCVARVTESKGPAGNLKTGSRIETFYGRKENQNRYMRLDREFSEIKTIEIVRPSDGFSIRQEKGKSVLTSVTHGFGFSSDRYNNLPHQIGPLRATDLLELKFLNLRDLKLTENASGADRIVRLRFAYGEAGRVDVVFAKRGRFVISSYESVRRPQCLDSAKIEYELRDSGFPVMKEATLRDVREKTTNSRTIHVQSFHEGAAEIKDFDPHNLGVALKPATPSWRPWLWTLGGFVTLAVCAFFLRKTRLAK